MHEEEVRDAWERRWGHLDGPLRHRFLQDEMMTVLDGLPRPVLQESVDVHRRLRSISVHARRLLSGEELAEGCDCDSVVRAQLAPDRSAHALVIADGPLTRAAGGRPSIESVHGMCACDWERYGSRASVSVAYAEHIDAHERM